MRLLLRFVIIAAILAVTLPLPPIGILVGALAVLWTLEYWRTKNLALKQVLSEKWLLNRQRLQAMLKDERAVAESEDEALDIDEIARDLADQSDQLGDNWLATIERQRAQIRRAFWRFVSAPLRLIGRAILSLTDDNKKDRD